MSGKRSPVPPRGRQSRVGQNRQNSQQVQHLSPPRSERVGRKAYGERRGSGGSTREGEEEGQGAGRGGGGEQWLDSSLMLQPPHRSQSFRHRPRPNALLGDGIHRRGPASNAAAQNEMVDSTPERRRSTPTIHRRASLCRGTRVEPRIDVWPEPKPMSEAEERFLQLPDFADWTRVRQFNIDAKGAVIHRGDSFRRKRKTGGSSTNKEDQNGGGGEGGGTQMRQMNGEEEGAEQDEAGGSSTRTSISTSSALAQSAVPLKESVAIQNGSGGINEGPSCSYMICVLGQAGSGKSSLIGQFASSSAFADADELHSDENGPHRNGDSTVSVNIGGHECELHFSEWDLPEQQELVQSQLGQFHAFLLVYSIDRKASFRIAMRQLEQLRADHCPVPVLLVGNKADLERKRAVMEPEVKNAMLTHDVAHFEVSVALNHDVDDLLVGIVAQVKESFRMNIADKKTNNNSPSRAVIRNSQDSEDFHAAIRRFSQRKKRQMGVVEMDIERGKCMNLFEKLRKWRKGTSNC